MDKFICDGGRRLTGTIEVSGSKNAALPILAATLLADKDECVIRGVPRLRDVLTMLEILNELGVEAAFDDGGVIRTRVRNERPVTAPYKLVSTMRASVCVLGPLVAKRHQAKVSLPGGCVIGVRPIDLHMKGLKALGAEIAVEHGYVIARARRLRANRIYLGGAFGSTVTGTANILMASVLAEGRTVIENAACEPEVQDLSDFLVKMGAKIEGIGTHRLVIDGVRALHGADHTVIPDRIEAGTFMIAAALTGGDLRVKNARADHLGALLDKFSEIGVHTSFRKNECRVRGSRRTFTPVDVTTLPYPGFPTDLQAQMMVLLSLADGISVVTEKIYPDRFMHVPELSRMGAQIRKEGPNAIIHGVGWLSGAPVMASDLRASAALILAGLVAKGTTEVRRVYHVDRGYEKMDAKLRAVGASIERVVDKKLVEIGGE